MKRELNHNILNSVDVSALLIKFKALEIATVFGVSEDYVTKVARLERVIIGTATEDDEMKLGRIGAWKLSIERKYIKQFNNLVNNNIE